MARRRLILVFAVALAALWTAWLGYEAYVAADPLVVSRPQILVAAIIIEGELAAEAQEPRAVKVTRIYRGQELLGVAADVSEPKDLQIRVKGISQAATGVYILPLREADKPGVFAVVPKPSSPGYRPALDEQRAPIYPANESTRLQVQQALGR